MNALIILGHPNRNSFNHALATEASNVCQKLGYNVIFHDLYAEGFDPILPGGEIARDGQMPENIRRHCDDLQSADLIVIVHPNWWGQPPAIVTGWIDRIIRPGVAYRFDEGDSGDGVPVGLLRAKAAIVLNTSNTPDQREQSVFGDPLESIWKKCVFNLCGVKNFHRKIFNVIVTSTIQQRHAWLEQVGNLISDAIANVAD